MIKQSGRHNKRAEPTAGSRKEGQLQALLICLLFSFHSPLILTDAEMQLLKGFGMSAGLSFSYSLI